MKKLFVTLVTAALLGVSAVCSASVGSVLDAEDAAVEKFTTAKDYKAVSAMLHDEMKANFKEDNFNKFREIISANFGELRGKTLRIIEKLDDADVLRYQAHFDKEPNAEYVFAFRVEKGKPLLFDFQIIKPRPEKAEQTPATADEPVSASQSQAAK